MDKTLPHNSQVPLDLDPVDRWNVFSRLQELSVPCECGCNQPLKVVATSPTAVLQIWSVIRSATLPRDAAIASLENCWNIAIPV